MTPETNLTEDRAQTKAFVEFSVLSFYGWWITTTINLFLSCSLHSPLHHNISWEFSYPCCPHKESALHAPSKLLYRCLATTDLLVGIFSPAYHGYLLDARGSRKLESLSVRRRRRLHTRLYIIWSVFVNDDGHKRGQTSRPVVGAEIQTNCNFETHVSHCSYLLGLPQVFLAVVYFKLPYNLWLGPCKHIKHITSSANLNHLVHKDFSYSQSSSGWSTTSCWTTAEPTICIEHGEIQKSTIQCTVGADCISCLLFTIRYNGNFYQP